MAKEGWRRRRKICMSCKNRFSTYEITAKDKELLDKVNELIKLLGLKL